MTDAGPVTSSGGPKGSSSARPGRSIEALKADLVSRSGRGAKYGLERMFVALDALDHPQRGLATVHVAGTNGKGSVCAMVEAIARAAGLRTGTFTSPHLTRVNERIRLDGEPIDDQRLADALERVLDPATPPLTFFEAITMAAFVAMRSARVDLAILEVGLGGRLDATNVIGPPLCAAISAIAADHTRILGQGDHAIAREKAGIVKAGSPLVIGPVSDEARDSIVAVAAGAGGGPLWMVARDDEAEEAARSTGLEPVRVERDADGVRIRSPVGSVRVGELGLEGRHQLDNAAVAAGMMWRALPLVGRPGVAAASAAGADLARADLARADLEGISSAIATGLAGASWPGRLERLSHRGVTVLLDCAHNPHGAEALAASLRDSAQDPKRTRLVFGAMDDKPWQAMLDSIGPLAHARYYCRPIREVGGRLPADPAELAAHLPGQALPSPDEALRRAIADAEPGDTVLVAGSIFLVGAVRSLLTSQVRDVIVSL